MNQRYDVITMGDTCVDLLLKGRDITPEFGQKEKMIDEYNIVMGGSCLIFASQCGRLGLKTRVAAKIGRDVFAHIVKDTLVESGVSIEGLMETDEVKTGITVALCKTHDRAMLTYAGTIEDMKKEDIPWNDLEQSRHLHIGSYFLLKQLQPHWKEIIECVKNAGGSISLDTNWDPSESWQSGLSDILDQVDIFFPNENEAMAVSGCENPIKAVEFLSKHIPIISVKLGAKGAITYANGKTYEKPAVDVPKVDAVGAGDSYDAGFVYGFLSGADLALCTQMGNVTGSLNIRGEGGTKTQPYLNEFQDYLA